jgi:hypothetical protein
VVVGRARARGPADGAPLERDQREELRDKTLPPEATQFAPDGTEGVSLLLALGPTVGRGGGGIRTAGSSRSRPPQPAPEGPAVAAPAPGAVPHARPARSLPLYCAVKRHGLNGHFGRRGGDHQRLVRPILVVHDVRPLHHAHTLALRPPARPVRARGPFRTAGGGCGRPIWQAHRGGARRRGGLARPRSATCPIAGRSRRPRAASPTRGRSLRAAPAALPVGARARRAPRRRGGAHAPYFMSPIRMVPSQEIRSTAWPPKRCIRQRRTIGQRALQAARTCTCFFSSRLLRT